MKIKNKIVSVLMATCLMFSSFGIGTSFADSSKVVTIGVNNTAEQKQTILNLSLIHISEPTRPY